MWEKGFSKHFKIYQPDELRARLFPFESTKHAALEASVNAEFAQLRQKLLQPVCEVLLNLLAKNKLLPTRSKRKRPL